MASSGLLASRQFLGLPEFDLNRQSVELEGTTAHERVSSLVPDGKLINKLFDDVESLHDCFMRGLKLSGKGRCMGWRNEPDGPYTWITYEKAYERFRNFGSGLIKKGRPAGNDTFIGIYSLNRVEWILTEQACNMYSMVIVPLYDTLGPNACQYIVNQADLSLVVCDAPPRAEILLDSASEMPKLKQIVLMDEPSESVLEKAKKHQIEILSFKEVEELGASDPREKMPPRWDNLCTICYTSGTTGDPKGAILTHGNIVSSLSAFCIQAGTNDMVELHTDDVYLSYLPLAHIYERFGQTCMYLYGGSVGFYQGDPKKLLSDMAELRPTLFPCVPRIMNKIYDKVNQRVAEKGRIAKFLMKTAIKRKTKEMESGKFQNAGIWDKVFKGVREMTGGRIRVMTTGAAPVSQEVKMFFRCAFGAWLIEGYGQTENGGVTTSTMSHDVSNGHVGCPLVSFVVKLVDVPDMEYYSDSGQGEICLKGEGVFKGYYKQPEKTAEALDEDGWLHTGDVGQWMPNGQLKIIDRKKHIFKLAQGEYVAPEKIENIYIRSVYVAQCFVYGHSLKSHLVAIVVPDEEVIPKLAKSKGVSGGDFKQLCASEVIKRAILEDVQKIGKNAKLRGFEQVKNIYLESEPFSVENNLLTPTLKSKRAVMRRHYAARIDELYRREQLIRTESVPFADVVNP